MRRQNQIHTREMSVGMKFYINGMEMEFRGRDRNHPNFLVEAVSVENPHVKIHLPHGHYDVAVEPKNLREKILENRMRRIARASGTFLAQKGDLSEDFQKRIIASGISDLKKNLQMKKSMIEDQLSELENDLKKENYDLPPPEYK
jgi:hypothetical protein